MLCLPKHFDPMQRACCIVRCSHLGTKNASIAKCIKDNSHEPVHLSNITVRMRLEVMLPASMQPQCQLCSWTCVPVHMFACPTTLRQRGQHHCRTVAWLTTQTSKPCPDILTTQQFTTACDTILRGQTCRALCATRRVMSLLSFKPRAFKPGSVKTRLAAVTTSVPSSGACQEQCRIVSWLTFMTGMLPHCPY